LYGAGGRQDPHGEHGDRPGEPGWRIMDRPGREDPVREGDGPEPGEAHVDGEIGQGHHLSWGLAPLPLVETALSPLDFQPGVALDHHGRFEYHDLHQRRPDGAVTLRAPGGLSPTDELVLYGLLAITFADPAPTPELAGTPDYLCRRTRRRHRVRSGSRQG